MNSYWERLLRRNGGGTRGFGKAGENVALAFLRRKGYRVRETNFICHLGEIDVIAEDGDEVVFIEVKSRRSASYAMPEESVGRKKKARIISIAEFYAESRGLDGRDMRFDIIAIAYDDVKNGWEIEHMADAFGEDS